jgi:hypothetical protein
LVKKEVECQLFKFRVKCHLVEFSFLKSRESNLPKKKKKKGQKERVSFDKRPGQCRHVTGQSCGTWAQGFTGKKKKKKKVGTRRVAPQPSPILIVVVPSAAVFTP